MMEMERGFFHPSRGYWQTTGTPGADILATYPEGTVEVNLKPGAGFDLVAGKWVEIVTPKLDPILDPPRFEWMLAFTGLETVWAALEAALRDTDRLAYATIRAQRAQARFRLPVTLALVDQFRAVAEAAAPGADLSEGAIRAAWAMAAEVEL